MNRLWTRDFTIITLGTVVSMLGNAISGFAISLLVLDYTGSVFLYALFIVAYGLPKVFMPLVAGPFLDAFSRKKVIYGLDFLSAALYFGMFFVLSAGWFNYVFFLLCSLLIGSIDGIYTVAYDSFYPSLISEGNYSKAYSISSMIYPLASLMTPVAAYVYGLIGVAPLFAFNAVTFFFAAVAETRIRGGDAHIRNSAPVHMGLSRFFSDLRDGLRYLRNEPGLSVITAYFFVTFFCGAADLVVLPYFRETPELGVQLYTYVMGAELIGRFLGGGIHYRFKYPTGGKFAIALFVYAAISLLNGVFMYLPMWWMFVSCFIVGILGVTSYSIRISSTQSYVPDEKRGRFNGVFGMATEAGNILGRLLFGALAEILPYRAVMLISMSFNFIAAFAIMGGGGKHVKKVYNRDV